MVDASLHDHHTALMKFEIIGEIRNPEAFASGRGIRELARLRRIYGPGHWRKRKGVADIRFGNGVLRKVELHWYEATGVGRREFKIKRFLD